MKTNEGRFENGKWVEHGEPVQQVYDDISRSYAGSCIASIPCVVQDGSDALVEVALETRQPIEKNYIPKVFDSEEPNVDLLAYDYDLGRLVLVDRYSDCYVSNWEIANTIVGILVILVVGISVVLSLLGVV